MNRFGVLLKLAACAVVLLWSLRTKMAELSGLNALSVELAVTPVVRVLGVAR